MTIDVTPSEARGMLIRNIQAGLVTMLRGSPSTAKSAIVKSIAEEFNLKLIDQRLAQCDPTDLLGFPFIDQATQRARYVPMETFPLETDDLPLDSAGNPMNGWLLFLDEFNSADKGVQKAAYKLVLDRMVGDTRLHKNVAMIAAGNLDTDGAIVEEMSTALQSRLTHIQVRPDHAGWLDWARQNGIDFRITSFIEFKPDCLYTFDPDKADTQNTYACYRTWEFSDRLLKQIPDISTEPALLPLFAGTISEGVAREFISFLKVFSSLPKYRDIVAAPENVPVPKEPGHIFALSGSIGANADQKTIGQAMKYIVRLPVEFQVVTLREILRRNDKLISEPSVVDWVRENGAEYQQ